MVIQERDVDSADVVRAMTLAPVFSVLWEPITSDGRGFLTQGLNWWDASSKMLRLTLDKSIAWCCVSDGERVQGWFRTQLQGEVKWGVSDRAAVLLVRERLAPVAAGVLVQLHHSRKLRERFIERGGLRNADSRMFRPGRTARNGTGPQTK